MKHYIQATLNLLLLAALAVGCSGDKGGSALVGVSSNALSAADVTRLELTITGPGIDAPIVHELVQSGNEWQGLITNIPAGSSRTMIAEAFDGADLLIYDGQATGVTIADGGQTLVYITLQESNPPDPFENSIPVIEALVASGNSVNPGGSIELQVLASDPDGDPLSYNWSATAGSFDDAMSGAPTWTAPAALGSETLTILVSDPLGATQSLSIDIAVSDQSVGAALIVATLNNWPLVSSMTSSRSHVDAGESTTLALAASDIENDLLTFSWSDGVCGGAFSDSVTENPTWTAPAILPGESCTLTVQVFDGRGGSTSGSLTIPLGPNAVTNFAPQVGNTFQSATAVVTGGQVQFIVNASDPEEQPITFDWSATTGSLSPPNTGATSSEILWTAPGTGCSHIISVAVADDAGGTTAHDFGVSTCASCGDGVAEAGELCDGADLNSATCTSIGLGEGSLACAASCTFDISECSSPVAETCDNGADDDWDGAIDCADSDCAIDQACFISGTPGLVESGTGTVLGSTAAVEMDDAGNAIVVWAQNDGSEANVYANHFDVASGTWGGETLIEVGTGSVAYLRLAVSASGNAVAVWQRGSGQSSSVYANRYDAATAGWLGDTLLGTGYADMPDVSMNDSGDAIAVWRQSIPTFGYTVFANTLDSSLGWGTAQAIEESTRQARNPQVAISSSGDVVAVWGDYSSGVLGSTTQLYGGFYEAATGSWAAPELLAANSGSARLAMAPSGDALVVWGYSASAFDRSTATWGAAEQINFTSGNVDRLALAIDDAGDALVTWRQEFSMYVNRRASATGSWDAEELLESGTAYGALANDLAVDAMGNAVSVWNSQSPDVVHIKRYDVVSDSWGATTTFDGLSPTVAVGPSMSVMAIWSRWSGTAYDLFGYHDQAP